MSMTLLWALICLIIFVVVLAHPKLPNWMTFICMAPVVLLAKVMEAKDIYAVLNNSSLHLMVIICMFSGMIAATGLDIIIGDFVDRVTSSQTGKKNNGLRVLGFAYKDYRGNQVTLEDEHDLTFIGLVSLMDPPRIESQDAVAKCKIAGIKPIMITGDHVVTARAIATQIGIYEDGDLSIEGYELDKMSEEELDEL